MEIIKKTIKQALTTGITETCTGHCRIIIPDPSAVYNLKILLTKQELDFGFFDAYTGITYQKPSFSSKTITGESTSRLNELKKHAIFNNFYDRYKQSTNSSINGVNVNQSTYENSNGTIKYYIDNITYTDYITNDEIIKTTYSFNRQSYSSPDFISSPIYKNPNKFNIISNPKISDDVFISRQQISAFDKNNKLNYIKNLSDLTTYAGGGFFNVINNT